MTLALKTDDEKRAQRDVVRVWMASLVRVFDGLPCSRDREWARGAQVLMRAGDYLHDPAANLKLLLEDVVYSLPRVDKK